jgi:MarR family transcriptional regulator for hemolysin
MDTVNDAEPFGKIFADLARDYVAVLSRRLDDLPIERYWWPLDIIDRHDGTLTQRELAEILQVDKTVIVRVVDHLSECGYVERKANPDDRRQHKLATTEQAKTVLPRIRTTIAELNRQVLDIFPEHTAAELRTSLNRLRAMLSQETDISFSYSFRPIRRKENQ